MEMSKSVIHIDLWQQRCLDSEKVIRPDSVHQDKGGMEDICKCITLISRIYINVETGQFLQ